MYVYRCMSCVKLAGRRDSRTPPYSAVYTHFPSILDFCVIKLSARLVQLSIVLIKIIDNGDGVTVSVVNLILSALS